MMEDQYREDFLSKNIKNAKDYHKLSIEREEKLRAISEKRHKVAKRKKHKLFIKDLKQNKLNLKKWDIYRKNK